MYLELKDITKTFESRRAVNDLSISIELGELVCLLGPSGCGKTTTLNMIGGFLEPDSGTILLDGADIGHLPPERRPVTTVFQSYALFPHMDIITNVMYGLKFSRVGRSEARSRAMRYLEMVGLGDRAKSAVSELSGGEQQRVALARSLVVEPKLCLLDEPFSNLDASLRVRMRAELKALQRELGITMLFVTHDQEEALVLSDRAAIMNEGSLMQCASPRDILSSPSCAFVAEFLSANDLSWDSDGSLLKRIRR